MELVDRDKHEIVDAKLDAVEKKLLEYPQAECPVIHRFAPGLYIRELHMPAGTLALGHRQRFEHWNVFLKGKVQMLNEDGSDAGILTAPATFLGKPGRKLGLVLEDVIWQNVYPTTETDVEKLEAYYLDMTEHSKNATASQIADDELKAIRDDYHLMLSQSGFSHETAVAQSDNEADQIPMPAEWAGTVVLDSPISGKGLFASIPFRAGEIICPARIGGNRTPAGRYTNHSPQPNAKPFLLAGGDIVFIALKEIAGNRGGMRGDEITIDYRDSLRLQNIIINEVKICLP